MKTTIKYILIVFIIIGFFGCSESDFYPCVKGSGKLLTTTRSLPAFTAVDFRMDGDVEVRYSQQYSIEIEGYENHTDLVHTEISNGKLTIDARQCLRNTRFHFIIYMPEVEGFKMQGSSSATIAQATQNKSITLEIAGSGNLTSAVSAPAITAKVSGSGNLTLAGAANQFTAQVSGSGAINGYQLVAKNATVSLSGSGTLKTFVQDKLEATISGSGTVHYKGNPQVTSSISGSGKLIKE